MRQKVTFACALVALALAAPAVALPAAPEAIERVLDENGEVVWEVLPEPSNPLLLKAVHYLRLAAVDQSPAKPGGGGGSNDCTATGYKLTGYHWTKPYSAYSTQVASIVSGALNEWDQNTGASISGGASSGNRGTAGTYDGVNQLAWVNLGSSSTIAVTTTWYYRGSGEAVESDGEYNTYYPWSSNGDPNAMDYENIIQHETGHTFGLGHPGSGSCLTMYAYADYGETQKRTLGVGDINGIKAIYGN